MIANQPTSLDVLVLNHSGQRQLAECLPSVIEAARRSRHKCRVAVIDNESTDGSLALLADRFREVEVICRPNRGLCSFNDVLATSTSRVALLLNNDIKLDAGAIDPLVAPLLETPAAGAPRCFMTAPLCWRFDGTTYEGFKTAVRWRWGLVQATALFPGHAAGARKPGLTASAGAALAVDRQRFLELGGFDPLYLPGRLEDLDFALRGYLAGYRALYVPQAVAYHDGLATFQRVMSVRAIERLALRNTLLFQWKNLRHPLHLVRHAAGLVVRLARDVAQAPWCEADERFATIEACIAAIGRLGSTRRIRRSRPGPVFGSGLAARLRAERDFFRRFHPRTMRQTDAGLGRGTADVLEASVDQIPAHGPIAC